VGVALGALGGQGGVRLGAALLEVAEARGQRRFHLLALALEGLRLPLDGHGAFPQSREALGLGGGGGLLLLDVGAALRQQGLLAGDRGLPSGGARGGGVVVGRGALLGPQRGGLCRVPVPRGSSRSSAGCGGGGLRGIGGLAGLRAPEARLLLLGARGVARGDGRSGFRFEFFELRSGSAGLADGLRRGFPRGSGLGLGGRGVGIGASPGGRGGLLVFLQGLVLLLALALEGELGLAEALLARGQGRLGAGLVAGGSGGGVVCGGASLWLLLLLLWWWCLGGGKKKSR